MPAVLQVHEVPCSVDPTTFLATALREYKRGDAVLMEVRSPARCSDEEAKEQLVKVGGWVRGVVKVGG